ncbi:MAG: 23S rRNA (guanosine(2251)-2'-O)-methyltransferase RlmB [Eubacteriales bacterium]
MKKEISSNEPQDIIFGRNSVKEAIKSERSINKIFVVRGTHDGSLAEILQLAKEKRLVIIEVNKTKLDEMCMPFGHSGSTGNHQGIVAAMSPHPYVEVSDIIEAANAKGEAPFVVVLDGVTDTNNLGSIIRSSEAMGVHGIVIGKRRSAPVNAAVDKASSGALSHMMIARVPNITAALKELKDAGVWVLGAVQGETTLRQTNMKGPLAIVIGSEEDGISRLVRETCDYLAAIPMTGKTESLNAAVAAAIAIYEKCEQDRA